MSNWKRKRYYIDRSENDKLIFITNGRKNVFVRDPDMFRLDEVDEEIITFARVNFQKKHPLSGWNLNYVDDELGELTECGLDASYRFFWKYCVNSNARYPSYDVLFRNLESQLN